MIFWTPSVHSVSLRHSFCNEIRVDAADLIYLDKSLSQLRDDHHLTELLPYWNAKFISESNPKISLCIRFEESYLNSFVSLISSLFCSQNVYNFDILTFLMIMRLYFDFFYLHQFSEFKCFLIPCINILNLYINIEFGLLACFAFSSRCD